MNADQFAERKEETIAARILRHGRGRLADVAHQLNRKGVAMAQAELCNEAVCKVIALCYQQDDDGRACNVDHVSGRLLIPAPWGRAGRRQYGLRPSEGNTLRAYLYFLEEKRTPPPLFTYDRRNWWLNVFDYPRLDGALRYWSAVQLDARLWKDFEKRLSNG